MIAYVVGGLLLVAGLLVERFGGGVVGVMLAGFGAVIVISKIQRDRKGPE